MSELPQGLLRAQRKAELKQRLRHQRGELRHHAQALNAPRPLKKLWKLTPATLSLSKAPSSGLATLLLALATKRLGLVGKLIRIGVLVYPLLNKKNKRTP